MKLLVKSGIPSLALCSEVSCMLESHRGGGVFASGTTKVDGHQLVMSCCSGDRLAPCPWVPFGQASVSGKVRV